ncbi:MAG: FAD-dependent oxidoreductase [Saprospiraceae bacterium]|nr:FAD-dependent oxidoreductase [Saprospiraceae bacterium]
MLPRVLSCLFISLFLATGCEQDQQYDLIIYGATSSGVAAAIQADRMGLRTLLVSPEKRIGGLTTGGLGQTDIGNKQVVGGISREFYQRVKSHYQDSAAWRWQNPSAYKDGGQTRTNKGEDAMWTFEPSTALHIYQSWLSETEVELILDAKLDRREGVKKVNGAIQSISLLNGIIYRGHHFIDATYEGDLMAAAGVSYRIGREANREWKETLNGVHVKLKDTTISGLPAHNAMNHNFVDGVDPYLVPGDPTSGLLPYINADGPGEPGAGDHHLQAYCFRMCLTDHPENRIPFQRPSDYQEKDYELLLRNYEAGEAGFPWINSAMPNRKTDTNNRTGFSTDFIGQNYQYPEASYAKRETIRKQHRDYQQGLMWTLANHPRIPDHIRSEVARWGTCKDEFSREDGWQEQLYIREARRLDGQMTMTQHHCEGLEVVQDPVGMGAYGMDSHHTQRYVDANGWVKNEGNVEARVAAPYPISYRAMLPRAEECSNLLVSCCVSATHIAFGSIRMEPVFMVLGQSAATAVGLAQRGKITLSELPYSVLGPELLQGNQILKNE